VNRDGHDDGDDDRRDALGRGTLSTVARATSDAFVITLTTEDGSPVSTLAAVTTHRISTSSIHN
jgi:hypothetical protein